VRRTEIQKRIIPRNWLVGRLSYIYANLCNITNCNTSYFTEEEIVKLQQAKSLLIEVIRNKKVSSEQLKVIIKRKQNE